MDLLAGDAGVVDATAQATDAQLDAEAGLNHLHINWCEGTVGDGAADCASKGESRVQSQARQLLWLVGRHRCLDGVNLGWRLRCHCCDVPMDVELRL